MFVAIVAGDVLHLLLVRCGCSSGNKLLLSTSDETDMKSGAWSLCDCDEKFCSRDELYQRKRDPEVIRFVAEVSGAKQGSHDSWRNSVNKYGQKCSRDKKWR